METIGLVILIGGIGTIMLVYLAWIRCILSEILDEIRKFNEYKEQL